MLHLYDTLCTGSRDHVPERANRVSVSSRVLLLIWPKANKTLCRPNALTRACAPAPRTLRVLRRLARGARRPARLWPMGARAGRAVAMATRGGGAALFMALFLAVFLALFLALFMALFLALLMALPSARAFSVPLQRPADCGPHRYFDSSRLACAPCGAHQRQSGGGERRAGRGSGGSALDPPSAAGDARAGPGLWP